jgi:hypothetical protein
MKNRRFVFQKKALSVLKIKIRSNVSDDFEKVLLTYLVENKALGSQNENIYFLIANVC